MRFVVLILVVALLGSLATYAVLNLDERVDVRLPWRTLQGQPQIYLVLIALGTGMVFVGILSLLDGTRLRLANRRLRREIERLQARAAEGAAADPLSPPPARETPASEPGLPPAGGLPSAGRSSMTNDEPPYGM